MAKRKKKSSKSPRIPIFDFAIDMATAAALDYIAYKRRQKRGGKRSRKIDPYEATGAAMGLGMINDTEDLIKFGGMLGMMGAFDPDDPDDVCPRGSVGPPGGNPFYAPKNNQYAWRLNCEDGSAYGISPEDYETRDAYHEALHREKYAWRTWCEDGTDLGVDPEDYETEDEYEEALEEARQAADEAEDEDALFFEAEDTPEEAYGVEEGESGGDAAPAVDRSMPDSGTPMYGEDLFAEDDFHVFVYCKVVTELGTDYYRTEDRGIKKGDSVLVPSPDGNIAGTVVSVEHHMRFSVPKPIQKTQTIVKRIASAK